MPRYRATITVPVPPGEAFGFVSDFRNAGEWDPRVSGAEKEPPGPVAVGTRFRLYSPLPGPLAAKEIELPYEVTELSPGERIVLVGETRLLRYRDEIAFAPAGAGGATRLSYDALLRLRGPLGVFDPFLRRFFRKVGDEAVAGIGRALAAEARRRREGGAAARVPDLSRGVTPEAVAAIVAMDDRPVLRNLLITESYHRIARRLGAMLGGEDVNWCAYAAWASKTAGVFLREEELHVGLRRMLLAKAPLRRRLRELHRALTAADPEATIYADGDLGPILELTGEIARFIRAGNREVFAELGSAFAAFTEEFEGVREADPARLEAFLDRFHPGESRPDTVELRGSEVVPVDSAGGGAGGQDLLREAMRAYHDALFETDPKRQAELVLLGSALGGLHEQTRLDPYIRGALDAPVDELFYSRQNDALAERLGRKTLGEAVQGVLHRHARRLGEELMEAVREVSTFYLMRMQVPGQVLELGEDLPAPSSRRLYPAALDPIEHPELAAALGRFGAYPLAVAAPGGWLGVKHRARRAALALLVALRLRPPVAFGSAARDWSDLTERMRYIFVYFRSRQREARLMEPPFTPEQTASILEGHVPRGPL